MTKSSSNNMVKISNWIQSQSLPRRSIERSIRRLMKKNRSISEEEAKKMTNSIEPFSNEILEVLEKQIANIDDFAVLQYLQHTMNS